MIPAASSAGYAVKTVQPVSQTSAARVAQPAAPEATRASAGESPAAHVALHSANALTAPKQSAVAPRLREQETAEQTNRTPISKDAPTGPPPAFEESPLERQARVAFDPPQEKPDPAFDFLPDVTAVERESTTPEEDAQTQPPADPPPTPTERAEASFAETRTLSTLKEPVTVDVEL